MSSPPFELDVRRDIVLLALEEMKDLLTGIAAVTLSTASWLLRLRME